MARSSLKNVIKLIEDATETLPVEKMFLSDLRRSIELQDQKSRRKPSQTYKPSGMNCLRSMYYQVVGIEPDESSTSASFVGICNSGSDTHERIQKSVLEMKLNDMDCEYINVAEFVKSRNLDYLDIVQEPDFEHGRFETKLYHKTLNISFLCDGIVKYKGHYYILEIKTESSNKFWNRDGVNPDHYNQATAYALSLQLNEVLFLYISRDTCDMKCFLYEVTDEMKHNMVGRIEECDGYVKRMIAPPRPKDFKCGFCGYKTQCRKDG